ncbi:SCO1 protein [Fomes fomentarius]|nr:SCO1 protein [Fomes fomentarius]
MSAPALSAALKFSRSAAAPSSRRTLATRHAIPRTRSTTSLVNARRAYSTNPNPSHQTSSGTRDRATVGVFTPLAAALFVATGLGLFFYFRNEKEKLAEQKRKEREDQVVGRPQVGGPFTLTTHTGETFTEKDLLGKWSLIYFGFTNCPDICPEELDKMSAAVNKLDQAYGPIVQPIFISVDPARDSTSQVARYVREFHPRLIGLTGSYATLKATCKAYRVYFSTPPDAKADDDYLVDHSIFFYFMDPNGQFVDAFGKASTEEDVIARVQKEIARWERETGRKV